MARLSALRLRGALKVRLTTPLSFPLLYAVAELVSFISEINPRRESAAESRFQLVSSTEDINIRSAASFIRRGRSILAKVVGEIDSRFGDFQQRLGQNAFGVNHVVAFELYVEVLELIVFALLVVDDGRPVDYRRRWH